MSGYERIGAVLAQARMDQEKSVVDVAGDLHIRGHYIAGLEAGELSELPGLPYVRGYLKRYAGYLNLDVREILRRFDEVAQSEKHSALYLPHLFATYQQPSKWVMLSSMLLLLACYALWQQLQFDAGDTPSIVDRLPSLQQEQ